MLNKLHAIELTLLVPLPGCNPWDYDKLERHIVGEFPPDGEELRNYLDERGITTGHSTRGILK